MENLRCKNRVVGFKQVKNAITSGKADVVYLAEDADFFIVEPLKQLCIENSKEYVSVSSRKTLAKALGIDVPTAAAATLNQ